MDERERVAWLARRAAFGADAGALDELTAQGSGAFLDRLVDPDVAGVPASPPSLWSSVAFGPSDQRRTNGALAIEAWLDALVAPVRPLDERMAWHWHGVLVSSYAEVPDVRLLARQIDLFRSSGLGSFRELLRAVTTDAAMLLYLDGGSSVAGAPNENYGREMLELFALGVGEFTEEDVQAAARALTGWRVRRTTGEVVFQPGRHDGSPQLLLGVEDVHDVESVVDAVLAHEACAPFVAGGVARALLGPEVDDDLVGDLAADLRAQDYELRPLVRSVLEAGLGGAGGAMVQEPVTWLVTAQRAVGATFRGRPRLGALQAAGQLPLVPPNVGGWPGGDAWLASSTTAARVNAAVLLAAAAPDDGPALVAARRGDLVTLSDVLLRPEGFAESTVAALEPLDDGRDVLAVALASPDLVRC